MANPDGILGPLGALHAEVLHLHFIKEVDSAHAFINLAEHATVKTFIATAMHSAIDNVTVTCGGTCYAALIPATWGDPGATHKKPHEGIGHCANVSVTTLYTPTKPVIAPAFVTNIIKPKTLIGEAPGLLLCTTTKESVFIEFDVHRSGVSIAKPW